MSRGYQTIVVDPPWPFEQFIPSHTPSRNKSWRRPDPYAMMSLGDIEALPVVQLAQDDCRLFCWSTSTHLAAALVVIHAWGFRYRQTLVWRKTGNPTPLPAVVAPNHAEFLLVCDRGKPRRIGTWGSSVIDAPKGAHSVKPEIFLDIVESVSPGPYLELFARRQRLGWDTWGNESLEHVGVGG